MNLIKSFILVTFSLSTFASEYQSKDLNTFLENFKNDTRNAMEKLPPKAGSLDNIDYMFGMKPLDRGERIELLRIKDEHRRGQCRIVKGEEVCLSTPDGRAQIAANDNPRLLVDSANEICSRRLNPTDDCLEKKKFVSNLKEMDRLYLQSAKLEETPWSDDYWPIAAGVLAKRYQSSPTPEGDIHWDQLLKNFEQTPADTFIADLTVGQLSPSEKYDLLVNDKSYSLTKKMWDDGRGYFESKGSVERWMGICHGWAAAAYMYPRPANTIVLKNSEGVEIPFYPSDIKGLGSLNYAKKQYATKFIGGRCNKKDPAKDENGRVIDPVCFDTNPGTWHQTVVNQIATSKRSFIIDATFDYEVWNQPVFSYTYKYFNPGQYKYADNFAEAVTDVSSFSTDKFKKYRSPLAKFVVGIEMDIEYVAETAPSARRTDSSYYDLLKTVTYRYDLELDENYEIIGGEWYTSAHPDFLWTPHQDTSASNYYDRFAARYSTKNWTQESGLNSAIEELAPQASNAGAPLSLVIDQLFKWSSEAK